MYAFVHCCVHFYLLHTNASLLGVAHRATRGCSLGILPNCGIFEVSRTKAFQGQSIPGGRRNLVQEISKAFHPESVARTKKIVKFQQFPEATTPG